MRCYICDHTLSDKEVNWNADHQDWEPCNTCQDVINDVFTDLTEEEIDKEIESEWAFLFQDEIVEPIEETEE